jgi:hypothetical protein
MKYVSLVTSILELSIPAYLCVKIFLLISYNKALFNYNKCVELITSKANENLLINHNYDQYFNMIKKIDGHDFFVNMLSINKKSIRELRSKIVKIKEDFSEYIPEFKEELRHIKIKKII